MSYTYIPHNVLGLEPAEGEISWEQFPSANTRNLLGNRWRTTEDLYHLSNPACGDIRTRTQALEFIDFQMTDLPTVISGISVNIYSQRNGRIADETIQLTYQGNAIGKNNFIYMTDIEGHLPIKNENVYGGSSDLWGAVVTPEMLQDPSFGIRVKFQAHPYYPHRNTMYLDSISLIVY